MTMDIFRKTLDALQTDDRLMLATVVRTTGSTPASALSKMLVGNSGSLGTVGGGSMEAEVIRKAIGLAGTGKAEIVTFHLNDDELVQGLICGGDVHILIEPVSKDWAPMLKQVVGHRDNGEDGILLTLIDKEGIVRGKDFFDGSIAEDPGKFQKRWIGLGLETSAELKEELRKVVHHDGPRQVETGQGKLILEPIRGIPGLVIFGGGHVSRSLTTVATLAGFHVTVADDREAYANPNRFPEASQTLVVDFTSAFKGIAVKPSTSIVIVTRGHHFDEILLEQALGTPAGYIGMIGSKQKVHSAFSHLMERGVHPDKLKDVHAPVGIEIGAVSPEEIAVSIVAELVALRRGKQGTFHSKSEELHLPPQNPAGPGTPEQASRFTN
ncbi:MAG: XdhC family protein [Bacteroidota bacterium]